MASKVPSAQIARTQIAVQRGTTLMGFLLGIGFSLIVAAIVAYFVYSAGSPFKTEKNANPSTSSLPAPRPIEPPKAVLKAEPAQVAVAAPAAPAAAPAAATAAAPAVAAPATAPAKATATERPAEKAPEKVAEKPAAAEKDETKPLFLQAGAFTNKSEAESRRAQLALVGLEAKISEITKDDKPMYRVRIGPFDSPESASRARGEMARNGIDSVLLK